MQKISGILPTTPRLTSADLKDSGAVRPGAPTFGRPIGESNLASRVRKSSIDGMMNDNQFISDRQKGVIEKAKIIEDLSSGFFMSKPAKMAAIDKSFEDFQPMEPNSSPVSPQPNSANDQLRMASTLPTMEVKTFVPISEANMNTPDYNAEIDEIINDTPGDFEGENLQASGEMAPEEIETPKFRFPGQFIDMQA